MKVSPIVQYWQRIVLNTSKFFALHYKMAVSNQRIIALSATVPNIQDVARWLNGIHDIVIIL